MTTAENLLQRMTYKSPLGWIKIAGNREKISEIAFVSRPLKRHPAAAPALHHSR